MREQKRPLSQICRSMSIRMLALLSILWTILCLVILTATYIGISRAGQPGAALEDGLPAYDGNAARTVEANQGGAAFSILAWGAILFCASGAVLALLPIVRKTAHQRTSRNHLLSGRVDGDDADRSQSLLEDGIREEAGLEMPERSAAGIPSFQSATEALEARQGENRGNVLEDAQDNALLKQTEDELPEAKRFARSIVAATSQMIYIYDLAEQRCAYAGPQLSQFLGYTPETIRRMEKFPLDAVFHPEDVSRLNEHRMRLALAEDGDACELECRLRDSGREWRWLRRREVIYSRSPDGSPRLILGIAEDLSRRKHLESRLLHAQKLEAVGILAGGIAHEFNNILSIIIGYAEMAQEEASEASSAFNQLAQVLKAADRARGLVKQIHYCSRSKDEDARDPLQVGIVIKEAVKFLRATLPSTIEIHHAVKNQTRKIKAAPSEIYQLLINLSSHAVLAMKDGGGIMGVELADAEVGSEPPESCPGLKPGSYLKLTVDYQCRGMESSERGGISDPDFAANVADGSGGPITVVEGIAGSLEGSVGIRSGVGNGGAVDVYLPGIERMDGSEKAPAAPVAGEAEHILFLDDEEAVADVWGESLKMLGYRVTAMTSSREAVQVLRRRPHRFDLIITDYVMPELTGEQVALQAMDVNPQIPVVIFTGFNNSISEQRARSLGIKELLMKPVNKREMAEAIGRALGKGQSRDV